MIGLETDRLVFRRWQASDFPAFADFFSDEENARFVGGTKSREESWRLMATYIGHFELFGYSFMAVCTKDTQELIGAVGVWNSEPWPEPELAYWLLPQFHGRGFGTEAGLAVKAYATQNLHFASLVSHINAANEPSIKLATRLGAEFDKTTHLLDFGPHEVYRYW